MGKPIHLQQVNREREMNAARKAASAYKLWVRGHSYAQIAMQLGYSNEGGAWKAVQRARQAQKAPPDVEEERQRERERLEVAYSGIAQRVEDGDVWAIDRAIALSKRKSELLGLDAKRDDAPQQAMIVQEFYPSAWDQAFSGIDAPATQAQVTQASAASSRNGTEAASVEDGEA